MQFVLNAACAAAKSKALVIWAPTVVMRHLQCRRPNQIFGCASSDAISHIVTVVLADRGTWAGREEPKRVDVGRGGAKEGKMGGEGGKRPCLCRIFQSSVPTSIMFGHEPGMHNTRTKEQYAG